MKNNKYVIDCKLGVVDYVGMVSNIVDGFFDSDGEYVPHIGKLNAMRLFYNDCVKESEFDIPHNITDAIEMDVLIEDKGYIDIFNKSLDTHGIIKFDFANAYSDAIKIVEQKTTSFSGAVESIRNAVSKLVKEINPVLSESNIEKLSKISDDISKGSLNAEAVVEALRK